MSTRFSRVRAAAPRSWLVLALFVLTTIVAAPPAAYAGGATPSILSFGNVGVNTSKTLSATINVDAGYKVGSSGGTGINAPWTFSVGSCAGFKGPGHCSVTEKFTPTGTGLATGVTHVPECPIAGGACVDIPLNLSATGVLKAAATPNLLNFGSVAINTTKSLSAAITVDAGYKVGAAGGSGINAPWKLALGSCGGFKGPGKCTITQKFTPIWVGGATGSTQVSECPVAGGLCIDISVDLNGSGFLKAAATPSTLSFGSVAVNSSKSMSATITIDAGYQVGGASGSGANAPWTLGMGSCAGFKGPGNCALTEKFTPASTGLATGLTQVSECPIAGGGCIAISLNVNGTGILKAAATPKTLSFGNVAINGSKTLSATLTLDAGYKFVLVSGSGVNPPWTLGMGSCAGFQGPGNCTITEKFTPLWIGSATASTQFSECPIAGGQCADINLDLKGTGI